MVTINYFGFQPIFLHRNLAYMKSRMSRNHKPRQNFRVDTLLNTVTNKHIIEEEKNGAPNNYMTLMFLGFYNKLMVDEQFVEVEIVVSKISQMKRKDSFKSKQDRVSILILIFRFILRTYLMNKSTLPGQITAWFSHSKN